MSASWSTTARWAPTYSSATLRRRLLGQGGLQRTAGALPSGYDCAIFTRPSSAWAATWWRPTPSAPRALCWPSTDLETTREINLAACKVAREVAAHSPRAEAAFCRRLHRTHDQAAFAGTHHLGRDARGICRAGAALIEGGVDILLMETCQDILQAKGAPWRRLRRDAEGRQAVPVQVQVTLEATGTMLLGTEIGAALTALEVFDVDAIGLNCATGPLEMNDAVRYLGVNSTKHVSVLPNAGLPQNVGGHAVYKLTPEELAEYHKHFVVDYGVRIVGGCCGTTPEHLKAVVEAVCGVEPAVRDVQADGGGVQRVHHACRWISNPSR